MSTTTDQMRVPKEPPGPMSMLHEPPEPMSMPADRMRMPKEPPGPMSMTANQLPKEPPGPIQLPSLGGMPRSTVGYADPSALRRRENVGIVRARRRNVETEFFLGPRAPR